MHSTSTKPNLLFFQFMYDDRLPEFLLIHKQEHVNCLSQHFNVKVISGDCDYDQLCSTHQPDLVLFESGVNHTTCHRPNIINTHRHPGIPKLGLQHGDGFCNARAGFISDMDHWGVETFFTISVTAGEHTPELADNLFVWPVFIDADVFKDYGSPKSIPVLFTGNKNQFYPWRTKIMKSVSEHYPSLICPHPGYGPGAATRRLMVGEEYARLINASRFVPACGTIAKEVVRKHFEIPGSRACLVTERSAGLDAAGFVDMKNCVFADEHDVLDKLELLFGKPDMLDEIIDAGYQLVHSRHTMAHRNQIFQWFDLHRNLKPGQKILQRDPFGDLGVVEDKAELGNSHVISNGEHLRLLRQGDESLWAGRYQQAEGCYLRCVNYMRWMPEVKLRLALCNLYRGNPKAALEWLDEPIHFILCSYRAVDPDPVEWAYFIVCLLCLGEVELADAKSKEFSSLSHPELDRVRHAADVLMRKSHGAVLSGGDQERRRSIHRLPTRDYEDWLKQLCLMLVACRQPAAAKLLRKYRPGPDEGARASQRVSQAVDSRQTKISRSTERFFERRMRYRKMRTGLKSSIGTYLHAVESKYGYFLPYRISESRNDEFFRLVRDLASDEKVRSAVIIGAARDQYSTQAFLAGILKNQNRPAAHCIEFLGHSASVPIRRASDTGVDWHQLSPSSAELRKAIEKIRREGNIHSFDLLLIDGSELDKLAPDILPREELDGAKSVILDDTDRLSVHKKYDRLSRDSRYFQAAYNPSLRSGYAIFKRFDLAGT
jgi:hypothetical protein